MKRLLIAGIGAIALLLIVVVVRTLMHQPPTAVNTAGVEIELNESALAERLSQSIQFQTVSYHSPELKDQSQFSGFIDWVHTSYPSVQESLEYIQLNDSMLYRWPGSDPSLQPILVTGHYDVVPVIPGSESQWQQPPFSGAIVDGTDLGSRGAG